MMVSLSRNVARSTSDTSYSNSSSTPLPPRNAVGSLSRPASSTAVPKTPVSRKRMQHRPQVTPTHTMRLSSNKAKASLNPPLQTVNEVNEALPQLQCATGDTNVSDLSTSPLTDISAPSPGPSELQNSRTTDVSSSLLSSGVQLRK